MLSTYTYRATTVRGTTSILRDELIACQHPTEDYGAVVHMDGDYVFDASLDESISQETRTILKELVQHFPDTELFSFNP